MLARKFAADFSERYRTPEIDFDEQAREVLLHFSWRGNVRQLKNVVEQVSLFEAGKTITPEILRSYLPASASVFSPVVAPGVSHSYASERELLFNMIFRMRNEIDTLRVTIENLEGEGASLKRTEYAPTEPVEEVVHTTSLTKYGSMRNIMPEPHVSPIDVMPSQPVRTLEDTEKETIREALERNEGRRKATAKELNISERTLYRKIKEYGLE